MRKTVSAYIIAKNEEDRIARAIDSVKWMDEIIVVDSGSIDRTIQIAEDKGAKVVYNEFENFIEQKNFAMSLCKGDFLFNLDADEEVSPELRKSIEKILESEDEKLSSSYKIARKTEYLGKWINHCGWYPEYRVRLSLKGLAAWEGEQIHEYLKSRTSPDFITGDLFHRPYRNLNDHIKTIVTYSGIWAEREKKAGRDSNYMDLLARPVVKFVKMFLIKAGFLDGYIGLIVCIMGAWYTFIKYARLYQANRVAR